MKLTLKDFGPIDEFTLDLSKDIQFIYGENSVGKSYAVFVLYAFSKIMSNSLYRKIISDNMIINSHKKNAFEKINGEKNKYHDITDEVIGAIRALLSQYFLRDFQNLLLTKSSELSKLSNQKNNKAFKIIVDFENITIELESIQHKTIACRVIHKNQILGILNEKDKVIEIADKNTTITSLNIENFKSNSYSYAIPLIDVISNEFRSHANYIYSLPANRTGIYLIMSSFSSIIAELTKSRGYVRNIPSIDLPMLSADVADYSIRLSNINSSETNDILHDFTQKIEKDILKGKVDFDDSNKKIVFYPDNNNLSLDLGETSSMIAEISIITVFFKYVIKKYNDSNEKIGNLVIIEEPESHLHPKTQVALMELFAELPKYGIKLIVTSHSDFMMDKLSNMILEGKVDADTVGSYRMVMGEKGSYDAGDMKASKDGIPDKNFVEISEKLYEERVDIYDQLNEKNAATEYNKS